MPRKTDAVLELIQDIATRAVPNKGELAHPFERQKQEKKKGGRQTTLNEFRQPRKGVKTGGMPDDVRDWTLKHFVDYFAQAVNARTPLNYRPTYAADTPVFQQAGKHLASNGLPKQEWTKRFIDWAVDKHEQIRRRHGYFTPQMVLRDINLFLQDVVMPEVEEGTVEREQFDTSLLEEIQEADRAGKGTEILARFGVPVTFTYLVKFRAFDLERLTEKTRAHLEQLVKTDRDTVARIFSASIIGSPYPAEFVGRDWREQFGEIARSFQKEAWWRGEDYRGRPLSKYRAIAGEEEQANA